MIEFRSILMKDKKFQGGFRLDAGTIIYARETQAGWTGAFYEKKGSVHAFALDENDFSLLQSGDCEIEELIVMPDPPISKKEIEKQNKMARRRLQSRITRHRDQADELEKLLEKLGGEPV